MRSRPVLAVAATVGVLALSAGALVAIRSSGDSAPARPEPLLAAPEPAVAPALSEPPAGQVLRLGVPAPEGVVVTADGTAAVATRDPGRLVIIAAGAGPARVLRTVAVPGAARHLQLAGPDGPVLVPGEDTDILSEVALPDGAVLRQTPVGRQPHDAAPAEGAVVVSDEFGMATSILRDGTRVAVLPGPLQPGGVAGSGSRAAVVDVRGRLTYVYDVRDLSLVAEVPAGAGPTHAVDIGGGVQVVADTDGDALILTRVTGTPAVLATVPLRGEPYGMAYDYTRRRLWIATSADNRLVQVDVTGPAESPVLTPGRSFPTVQQPNSVAVLERTGRVLVAGATPDGTLQVLDP